MFERFTDRSRKVMALANQEALRFNHEYVGTEHILLGLAKEGAGVGANVLKNLDIDLQKVRAEVEKLVKSSPEPGTAGKLPQTPRAKKVIEYAIEECRNLNHMYVGTEHLLLGLLREHDGVAAQVLMNLNLELEDVREEVLNLLGTTGKPEDSRAPSLDRPTKHKSNTPALDSVGRDLMDIARQDKLDVVFGRSQEIERVITVLHRRGQNSPVLVGRAHTGRKTIVEGVAQRIVEGDVPSLLVDHRIISLDWQILIAGTKNRSQLEERLKAILIEVQRAGNIILFTDDIRTLVGAGSLEGDFEVSSVMKTALSRGEIQCIVVATPEEYHRYIQANAELERHFQPISIDPLSARITIEVLKNVRDRFEAHHRVQILDEALEVSVELSELFIPERLLPDKSINLIDEAGARVRMNSMTKPPDLKQLDAGLRKLMEEKDELVKSANYERAAQIRDQMDSVKIKKRALLKEWRERSSEIDGVVDADEVVKALSRWTGIDAETIRKRDTSTVPQSAHLDKKGLPHFERLQCESILHGQDIKIQPGTGFVLMPHRPEFRSIYDKIIEPVMAKNGIKSTIAQDIYKPGAILNQVWSCIRKSEVIVADVSGCNANVIYELGLCFGLHRLPIILLRDPNELPFNLQSLRYIQYEDSAAGAKALEQNLSAAITEFLAAVRSARPEI